MDKAFCPQCGMQVKMGDAYCPECGLKLPPEVFGQFVPAATEPREISAARATDREPTVLRDHWRHRGQLDLLRDADDLRRKSGV